LRRSSNWYRFERGCRRLQQFVGETCGEIGRQRQQVLVTLVGCLIEDLDRLGIGVGPTTLGDRMMQIFDVVEVAFPGYVAAGVLQDALLHNIQEGAS
jgi:hypothetical protein